MTHESQIVRAKETSSWAMVDSAKEKHQAPTNELKVNVRAVSESEPRRAIKKETCTANMFVRLMVDLDLHKLQYSGFASIEGLWKIVRLHMQ